MATVNDVFAQNITVEAEALKNQYSENALLGLLEAEQIRIQREGKITLGKSPKDLVQGAVVFILDKLQQGHVVTDALLMTYVVNYAVDYLITQGIIAPSNIERERFVIALVVSLITNALYKAWEEYRKQHP